MTRPGDIAVAVEATTGNVKPLLHELRHALGRVVEGGEGTVIDLRSLPLAPGEEARIETLLGTGEVCAELNALGTSTVQETRFAGIWLVTHRNAEDEIVARFVEVCRLPQILLAQPEDMQDSLMELTQQLGETTQAETTQAEPRVVEPVTD